MLNCKCPYCATEGCYNSGFTIECTNPKCKFYSKKQQNWYLDEKKKNEVVKVKVEPPKTTLSESEIQTSYGPKGYPGPYGSIIPIQTVPMTNKTSSTKTANLGNTQIATSQTSLADKLKQAYQEKIFALMKKYTISYNEAKNMADYNVDV